MPPVVGLSVSVRSRISKAVGRLSHEECVQVIRSAKARSHFLHTACGHLSRLGEAARYAQRAARGRLRELAPPLPCPGCVAFASPWMCAETPCSCPCHRGLVDCDPNT